MVPSGWLIHRDWRQGSAVARRGGTVALCIDLAIAKTNKYASRESGDTAEVVERAGGGISVVVVDGQGSGRAAKPLSFMVTATAVALLLEGVRDGAVARAAHDGLFAFRHGQVSATFDLLSVDLRSGTLVVTRNATTPLLLDEDGGWRERPPEGGPIGLYPLTRPEVFELPLAGGLGAVVATDGVFAAGRPPTPDRFDLCTFARSLADLPAQELADRLLAEAVRRDGGKPADDMTVVALRLLDHGEASLVRRLHLQVPLP